MVSRHPQRHRSISGTTEGSKGFQISQMHLWITPATDDTEKSYRSNREIDTMAEKK